MNEDGDIYMESFHLTWDKNIGFYWRKSHKLTFFRKALGAPCAGRMCLPGLGAWIPLACTWELSASFELLAPLLVRLNALVQLLVLKCLFSLPF